MFGPELTRIVKSCIAFSVIVQITIPLNAADKLIQKKSPRSAGKLLSSVFFSPDGGACYSVDDNGHILEQSIPDFKTLREKSLNTKCSAFGRWSGGFAVYADATQELIILDLLLNETGRVKTPGLTRFATSPALEFGYVIAKNQIGTVDLKRVKLAKLNTLALLRAAARVKRPEARPAPLDFQKAACTLDGKYLVSMADHRINRFAIKRKGALFWEESGWKIGSSGTPNGLNVGGLPSLVAMPYGAGNNDNVPGHPNTNYGTFVYDLKKLSVPKVTLESGAYPSALGFDRKLPLIYAQNFEIDLIVYNHGGAKLAEYKLDHRNAQTKAIFPHLEGGKMMVLTEQSLFWCELPTSVLKKAG